MAPSAETESVMTVQQQHKPKSFAEICSRRTIANAVNYEPSMVDFFHHSIPSTVACTNPTGNPTGNPTESRTRTIHGRSNSFVENQAPNHHACNDGNNNGNTNNSSGNNKRRTSKRESKQRSISLNPSSVRYDMELVPRIQKNASFYDCPQKEAPFFASVLWRPNKRKDWEDCLSELVAVCTSAGLRQFIARHKGKRGKKPQFTAPLSRDYIRDRIDIDDPLRGVQIRHATQGWLQGYLLWTNFTTWTHYFAWDSMNELSGLQKCEYVKDADGVLAQELNSLPRTGSPQDAGVIFESIAEIALVGGLGCGDLLLRMALEEIIAAGKYDYVVLQATSGSRTFYERYGFKRVGAVCRYGEQGKLPNLDTPVQGYRHWTHANESQKSLDMHGGPSYMMVLKIADYQNRMPLLLEALEKYTVADRPTIVATPMSPTPKALKKLKRASSIGSFGIPAPPLPNITSSRKRVFCQDPLMSNKRPRTHSMETPQRITPASSPMFGPVSTTASKAARSDLITPPPDGKPLSYAQKQYQSPWLAVPSAPPSLINNNSSSNNSSKRQRKPPRSRSSSSKTTVPTRSASAAASNTVSPLTPKKVKVAPAKLLPNSSSSQRQVVPFEGIRKIDKTTLCKQKVKSYPRDRAHFYNKVVTVGSGSSGSKNKQPQYYFCLHYDEPKQLLTLCPMAIKGVLSGRRQGRPRYQCVLLENSKNWICSSAKDCETVEAFMVMKTPIVAQEAWDILSA
ncbi:unnamed protein product [Cylindrotheca closterium]|uniref:N-acetyltransferase domain-containing protein n=1 Tax=Cylindrotheca closterium TaxID=2856 RepID=A0AAD2FVA3_9STRA|nr:unnamed protein product [Cylindrotheca closterium]